MRVTHVCTHDGVGGAARSARRLHAALRDAGVDSRMVVARRTTDDPDVTEHRPLADRFGGAARRVARGVARRLRPAPPPGPRFEIFSRDLRDSSGLGPERYPADLHVFHWVAGFADSGAAAARFAARGPVVWRLSDMAPFTGGCHYDAGCGRFAEACHACPQLHPADRGLAARNLRRKAAALDAITPDALVVVGQSRWITEESKRSRLLGRFRHETIPNGVDTDTFRPDAAAGRASLGADRPVIAAVAQSFRGGRKGFDLFAAAIAKLAPAVREACDVVVIGKTPGDLPAGFRSLGEIDDPAGLAAAYAAADLFVCPSRQDNLPNTVLESLACGTPVVAFDVGGLPDLVTDGVDGHLVPPFETGAMAARLTELLGDADRRRAMGHAARRKVEADFTLAVHAARFRDLFAELVAAAHRSADR